MFKLNQIYEYNISTFRKLTRVHVNCSIFLILLLLRFLNSNIIQNIITTSPALLRMTRCYRATPKRSAQMKQGFLFKT